MRSYKIALMFISALIVGGTVGFFITGFASAGSIEKNITFYYEPTSTSSIESLDIFSDIGKLEIKYNSSNTPYYAKIDVSIKIGGLFMRTKSYTDFFKVEDNWWNSSTGVFKLETIPDIWFDPSYWFKSYNITVSVILRTDIVYNLNGIVSVGSIEFLTSEGVELNETKLETSTGSIKLFSSKNVNFQGKVNVHTSTGSVDFDTLENSTFQEDLKLTTTTGSVNLNAYFTSFSKGIFLGTSTGSIDMNMEYCSLNDNLLVIVSTGGIKFHSDDMEYLDDCLLDFKTSTGSIEVDISHYNDLNANITASYETSTGRIDVRYRDYNLTDGMKFICSTSTGSVDYTYYPAEAVRVGDVLTSINYNDPFVDTYTFTCTTSTGSISVDSISAV